MALYADGLAKWDGGAGQPIYFKDAQGNWVNIGAPEHAESASYIERGLSDPQLAKLITLRNTAPQMLNNEQQAFFAGGMGAVDSLGQGYRWATQDLFDNRFDPQQAGHLLQTGFSKYLSPSDIQSGQQFNFEQSPAEQSKRADDGGLFGLGGLGELAMLAAAVYTGGAALGAWGGTAAAAGAGAATTASGMLAAESASMLASGFTAAEVAGSLAGLGSAAEIGSILAAAGIPAATAASLGQQALSGMFADTVGGQAAAMVGNQVGAASGDWISLMNNAFGQGDLGSMLGNNLTSTGADTIGADLFSGLGDTTADIFAGQLTAAGMPLAQAVQAGTAMANAGVPLSAVSTAGGVSNLLSTAKSFLGSNAGSLLTGGMNIGASLLQGNAAEDAARTSADAQIRAAQIAADAAKFRPVGVKTGFGESKFGYDANGNLISAGYQLTPEMKAQQDQLMAASGGMIGQFTGSQAATAPMGTAAQRAMQLGQGYLATDPAAQAAKFMTEQQQLLAPGRATEMANLQEMMQAQGRGGFAIGGDPASGMMASNPQMQALYNARLQQDRELAAQSTQGGMDYAKFGAAMVGTGGDLLKGMYGTQSAAFAPYQTALGGAQTIEGLGQNAMDLGLNIGAKGSASTAASGALLASGMTNAANTMQGANSYSPWAGLLAGGSDMLSKYMNPQQQQTSPGTFKLVALG